jgi:hypothetical protein
MIENMTPLSIVTDFIGYVNQGDTEKVNALISKDVVFTDIQGRVYEEPEFMENYLKAYPKYNIHIRNILRGGKGVAVVGYTSGSHVDPEIEKNEVLVWTVEVKEGQITYWRIYSTEGYAN